MNHGNGKSLGSGYYIDLFMRLTEVFIENYHGEYAGSGRDITCSGFYGVGCTHSGSGISLTGCKYGACSKVTALIKKSCTVCGKSSCLLSCLKNLGKDVSDLPCKSFACDHSVKGCDHLLVIITGCGINGEHSRRFTDAHILFSGKAEMNVTCKGCKE